MRKEVDQAVDRLGEKFGIQELVEKDPELKRKITIDMHYIRLREL